MTLRNKAWALAVGQKSTAVELAGVLGDLFEAADGKAYRLVQAGEEIASPGSKVVVFERTAGANAFTVVTTTTASSHDVAGTIPASYTDTIDDGDYFLVQFAGDGTYIAHTTDILDGDVLVTGTAAGRAIETTAATDASVIFKAAFAVATNTAGVTAAGQVGTCQLRGML